MRIGTVFIALLLAAGCFSGAPSPTFCSESSQTASIQVSSGIALAVRYPKLAIAAVRTLANARRSSGRRPSDTLPSEI